MGKQSSRIYYKGKDHKDIYYNHHYHSAMYICEESESGKVECKLVWRKIFDENLYIHSTVKGTVNSEIHILPSITVDIDKKKVYPATNYTFRDGKQQSIIYDPVWVGGKEYLFFFNVISGNGKVYINKELVFNYVIELNGQLNVYSGTNLNHSEYPANYYYSSTYKLLTIKKLLIEEAEENGKYEATLETISKNLQDYVNLNGYKVENYNKYNNGNYIYMLARSAKNCMLIRSDLDGNIKTLKLENFDSTSSTVHQRSPIILSANEEKIYLLSTKVMEDKNSETVFIVNSITTIDNMDIASTEAIDSWSENKSETYIYEGSLAATVYMPTVFPITFIYSRDYVTTQNTHSSIITIDENGINVKDININNFSFFVNLYEDGEIVDTIMVSSEPQCTDIKNGIVWLNELSAYFGIAFTSKTDGFSSTVHYTADGWVEGGTHGVFYDEETQYFYTFYIEKLYSSSSNFFIRFKV